MGFLFKFSFLTLLMSPYIATMITQSYHELAAVDWAELFDSWTGNAVVIQPTFIFDAPRLTMIKTQSPANYNQVKAQALFELFVPIDDSDNDEEPCCKEAEIFCRIRAVTSKYLPAFVAPFLQSSSTEPKEEEPIDSRAVIDVLEHALRTETTPAYLPSHGALNKDTALAFYQLVHGAFRNAEPEEDEDKIAHDIEQETERCAETDSLKDILMTVFVDLPAAAKIAKWPASYWLPSESDGFANLFALQDVALARFRMMPSIRFQYHLQGSLTYELEKNSINYQKTCENLWEQHPSFHPSFARRLLAFFDEKPVIKERACFDANPLTSDGVSPVEVATCNAYALDPEPVDYNKLLPRSRRGPSFWHMAVLKKKAPLIPPVCHERQYNMYEFLNAQFDYTLVCSNLWTKHWHTAPWEKRRKTVKTHDNTKEEYWRNEFVKQPLPLDSFCLSFELDRNPKPYMGLHAPDKKKKQRCDWCIQDIPNFVHLFHAN